MTVPTAAATTSPARTRWAIDPSHSSIEFAVKHLMISTVKGHFRRFEGAIDFDEADPTNSRVELAIDPASIDTREPARDDDLRSANFFDVARYPEITFRSLRVVPIGEAGALGEQADGAAGGTYRVEGHLTLHGITRPVSLEVRIEGDVAEPDGAYRRGFSAETRLNRRDFGLSWDALETGGVVVGDLVKVTAQLEAVRQTTMERS